jgi:hypothetical protein
MQAWTSLSDTSAVKTYREALALKTTHFGNPRVPEICCFATNLPVFKISKPACKALLLKPPRENSLRNGRSGSQLYA